MIDVVTTILAAAGFVPAVAFAVLYSRVEWWRSPEGRHLMAMTLTLATALGLILAVRVIGRGDWTVPAALAVYTAIAWLMWHRFLLLIRAQWRKP